MSVREEDRNKNCPSRGLGIAAAAIGVGVGAALYYFFSKRPEHPADEGATTSGWNCDQPHALHNHDTPSSSSYTTIDEHSTTDTSMESSSSEDQLYQRTNCNIMERISRQLWQNYSESEDESESEMEYSFSSEDVQYVGPMSESIEQLRESDETHSNGDIGSDSETNMQWDVTTSSLDVPTEEQRSHSPIMQLGDLVIRWFRHENRQDRERSWSLEECPICFEVMLKDQEVMALVCTHRFHQPCILPWLQEQQTCPVCRKAS